MCKKTQIKFNTFFFAVLQTKGMTKPAGVAVGIGVTFVQALTKNKKYADLPCSGLALKMIGTRKLVSVGRQRVKADAIAFTLCVRWFFRGFLRLGFCLLDN